MKGCNTFITNYSAICLILALGLVGCEPASLPEASVTEEKEIAVTPTEEEPVPEEEPAEETGEEDAFESAREAVLAMGAGWNLGNTLDSNSGDLNNMWIEAWTQRTPRDYETAWGQVPATRELIHLFKEAGFGGIRVPVTWYPHMGTITLHNTKCWDPSTWEGYEVDSAWMDRVQEVVDYVIGEGLYCILNVHHDTGAADTAWLVAGESEFAKARARYQALWEQIAERFKDYGEKLLFESYNEMLDSYDSWCFASFGTPARYDAQVASSAYEGINQYAALFVETVRGSGGNNAHRNLIVNTYGACSGDGSWNSHLLDPLIYLRLPEDGNHLAVQIHSYWDANEFASQKTEIDLLFSHIKTQLQEGKGVPVIIGEWGGGTNEDSDANVRFASYLASRARENGVAAFWWMGLSDGQDRAVPQWTMPRTKDAIIQAYHANE